MLYIKIRIAEYSVAKPKPSKSKQYSNEVSYPFPDLDLKTKVYIDHLLSRVKQLEQSIRYLNEEILEQSWFDKEVIIHF